MSHNRRSAWLLVGVLGGVVVALLAGVLLLLFQQPEDPVKPPDSGPPLVLAKDTKPSSDLPTTEAPKTPPEPAKETKLPLLLKSFDLSKEKREPVRLAFAIEEPAAGAGKEFEGVAFASVKGPGRRPDARAAIHPGVDQAKVDRAIDLGVRFLKAHAAAEPLLGAKALAGLALLHSGVPRDDATVAALAREVRDHAQRRSLPYDVACCIWFLDRLGVEADRPLIRSLALRLIANQQDNGGWGYIANPTNPAQEKTLLALLGGDARLELAAGKAAPAGGGLMEFAGRLPADLKTLPVLRYVPGKGLPAGGGGLNPNRPDNSITQFAVLALWVAKRHGVPAERSLLLAEERFRTRQAADGGWSYEPGAWVVAGAKGQRDTGTCAGLLALACGAAVRAEGKEAKAPDEVIDKGFAFLGRRLEGQGLLPAAVRAKRSAAAALTYEHFKNAMGALEGGGFKPGKGVLDLAAALLKGAEGGPGAAPIVIGLDKSGVIGADAHGDFYYLWSLERVAVAYDLKTIGKRDWYAWGVSILLDCQQADGSWREAFPAVPDTCFALLFLRRANLLVDLTEQMQRVRLSAWAGEREGQGVDLRGQMRGAGVRSEDGGQPGRAVGMGTSVVE